MSENAQNIYGPGDEGASGELEHLLGQEAEFLDLQYDSASPVKPLLSAMLWRARWVKNEAGGAVTAGQIVIADTGATYGPVKATGAAVTAGTNVAVGNVDPFNVSVADNAHYWLVTRGPTELLFTTGTTHINGDILIAGASGRAVNYDHTSVSIQGNFDRIGKALVAVDTAVASDTLFRALVDYRI